MLSGVDFFIYLPPLKNQQTLIIATFSIRIITAQMVKLVDTLVSGTSGRKSVQVRVLFWAPDGSSNCIKSA